MHKYQCSYLTNNDRRNLKLQKLKHLLQFKMVNSKQLLLINGRFIQDVL